MSARSRILSRLRTRHQEAVLPGSDFSIMLRKPMTVRQRIDQLRECMVAVQTEVHCLPRKTWAVQLLELVRVKGLGNLLYAPAAIHGREIESAWAKSGDAAPKLLPGHWNRTEWKRQLFTGVDAAITSTRGGIADTGSLVLWPDQDEPRLMSLAPPVHFAVLDGDRIHDTFLDMMRSENWVEGGMPSNVVLISGPSKTADIEQTLAYGVHGPKELVVIVLDSEA